MIAKSVSTLVRQSFHLTDGTLCIVLEALCMPPSVLHVCMHRMDGPPYACCVPSAFCLHPPCMHAHTGRTSSRCAGYCDDDLGHCYCSRGSKYSHIPAPLGSPPGKVLRVTKRADLTPYTHLYLRISALHRHPPPSGGAYQWAQLRWAGLGSRPLSRWSGASGT